MLGAILALASAAFFGLNNATLRRGVIKGSVLHAMAVTVPAGVPLFVLLALVMGGFASMATWPGEAWLWMTLAGLIHFVIGRYGNYKATQLLGGTLSTPIQQLSIIVALALAYLFLDERIGPLHLAGIALILAGPLALGRAKKRKAAATGFEPSYGPGIAWGAVAAAGYGTSPLLIALGIGDGGIAASVGGLLVSYTAASVVVVLIVIWMGGASYMRALDRDAFGWFLMSALFVALSQFFRYVALAVAPVSVVTPIQRLSVVFRILFNAALNREHEVLDRAVIVASGLSVLGAVFLTVPADDLLGWTGLSRAALRWLAAPLF